MSYELLLDALGDSTRRRIVERLRSGPASVGEIAAPLPVSRPAVSKHLKVLEDSGLVTFEPAGTRNIYRLDPRGLDELRAWTEGFWQDVLANFAVHAESESRPGSRRKGKR